MQLVQSNDKANRASFKDALAHKVEAALTAPVPTDTPDGQAVLLLLPSNFQELDETQLHFSLMHNRELKHSRQSATMAVDIVHGKMLRPKNVTLSTVQLASPVEIPQFDTAKPVKRSPGRALTPADSSVAILANEEVKRSEYQHYLANMFQRTAPEAPKADEQTLRVPANWNELSEPELFFTLTHQTELEHTRQSAYLAMDILSGKIETPAGVTLQEVVLFRPVTQPKPEFKVQTISKPVKTVQAAAQTKAPEEQILLLPTHYEELSDAGLFYTLTHNPELKHSTETANLALSFLNGVSSKPEWVKFQTIDLVKPANKQVPQGTKAIDPLDGFIPERELEKRAALKAYLATQTERVLQAQPIEDEEVILRLPKNYKELSQDALLETLIRNQAYKHSQKSAYLALDIMAGKIAQPANVKFRTVTLPSPQVKPVVLTEAKKIEAAIHPDILANEEAKKAEAETEAEFSVKLVNSPLRVSEQVLRIPENYLSLSQNELLYVLLNDTALAHDRKSAYQTIDILSGVVQKPSYVTLQAVATKPETVTVAPNVQTSPAVTSLHPLQDEASRIKREQHKEFLAEKARVAYNTKPVFKVETERVVLLPEGYESMNPGELHFALIRNPEFKHTPQQAVVTADMLSGRIGTPSNVKFQTVKVDNIQLATTSTPAPVKTATVKVATEASILPRASVPMGTEGRVLLLPTNYAGMTETQLHFALSHNREYGHSYESTYEAIDIVFGRKACPDGTVFNTVSVENPVERAY